MAELLGFLTVPAIVIGVIIYPFIKSYRETKEAERWNSLTEEEKWQEKLDMIRKLK